MRKSWLLSLTFLLAFLPLAKLWADPVEGGNTSPDGTEWLLIDLPVSERKINTVGLDGLGLCVWTSMEYAARWQQEKLLYHLQEDMRWRSGGGYPEKVSKIMAAYYPDVRYVQQYPVDLDTLHKILASGRMACITYAGHDPHYGARIDHMVCLIHLSEHWACILDSNFPGEKDLVWMSPEELRERVRENPHHGWVIWLRGKPD